MTRIEEIVSFIDENDFVADIGCDQVEVGVLLAKKGIKSIGSDISSKVISKAKEKVKKLGLEDYITLNVSDGLNNIDDKVDTLVLAGMGAFTISDIILKSNKRYKKIITISNTDNDYLRYKMTNFGYSISCEKIIYDKGKYYNIIVFGNGKQNYSEKELMIGVNIIKNDTYYNYHNYLLNKYKKILLNSNYRNEKVKLMIDYLESSN